MADGKFQALMQETVSQPVRSHRLDQDYSVQHHFLKPAERPAHLAFGYSLTLHLSSPVLVEWSHDRVFRKTQIRPGDISCHSIGELPAFHLREKAEILEVSLSPVFVQKVLQNDLPAPRRLTNTYGVSDPQAEYIARALHADEEAECPTGRLLGESLASALTVYLFGKYQASAFTATEPTGGLSRRDAERTRDYIHAHLADDVTLTALAALTAYSIHHFTLLFKRSFGISPHQYVLRARVEEARRLLSYANLSLGEIAYRVGFANQSHFSLHFKRLVGATPRQYREAIGPQPFS